MLARVANYLWYEFVFWTSLFALSAAFSLRVAGRRNFPRKGSVLVVANHQSFIDPVLVGLCCPRHPAYIARQTLLKNRWLGRLVMSLGMVPIDHEGGGLEGLRESLALLEGGRPVIMFPEGTRSPDGNFLPLRPGVALLIKRGKVPVLPVGIAGAFDAWPRWRKYPLPAPVFLAAAVGTIGLAIGKPIPPERFAGLSREQILELLESELRSAHRRAEAVRRRPG
jgi:1-acyl-sn-glycerol-3-phosphate acyltransferase